MNEWGIWRVQGVSDGKLEGALRELLSSSARTEARIAAHLAEVEARSLHLRAGYQSMYEYCMQHLGLSENEAFHRIAVARVASAFPVVFGLLERRAIHLSAICVLRRYLTPENHRELLDEACHNTKRQVEELVVRRFPGRDVRSELRQLPRFEPVTGAQYRLTLAISVALKEKLELLRDLVSHANPSGDQAIVVERAVDLALAQVQKRRFATPKQSVGEATVEKATVEKATVGETNGGASTGETSPGEASIGEAHLSRAKPKRRREGRERIRSSVRREVVERDGLSCSYVGDGGHRCGARALLQFEHEEAWSRGGADTADNLRLLCAQHNGLRAEQELGKATVELAITARRERT